MSKFLSTLRRQSLKPGESIAIKGVAVARVEDTDDGVPESEALIRQRRILRLEVGGALLVAKNQSAETQRRYFDELVHLIAHEIYGDIVGDLRHAIRIYMNSGDVDKLIEQVIRVIEEMR